jgi:hypothetical protein
MTENLARLEGSDRSLPVTSEERFALRVPLSLAELADRYFSWQTQNLPLVKAVKAVNGGFGIRVLGITIIRLGPPLSAEEAELRFPVVGGWVAKNSGALIFRHDVEGTTIRLAGYESRLPLWLYRITQLRIHNWVTARFRHDLEAEL